jgi:adenylate cyclase class 2
MLEVEMKFPVADGEGLRNRLEAMGARLQGEQTEVDRYFNAPDRDFAKTDEALRLRQIGARNILTYKGPKVDAQTKTRVEIEAPLGDGQSAVQQATELFHALGYRTTAVLRKQRTLFELDWKGFEVTASLDDAEGLGLFAEIEVLADEKQLDAARQAVRELADQLGLSGSERRSYLEMWLEKHGPHGDR